MSQLETIKKQIETIDKVLAETRKTAEAIRCETSAKISTKLTERGINHKRIEYSVDSIRLGATEGREDVSIYTRSQWNDETKVKIEISWYSSSATVGVEGDMSIAPQIEAISDQILQIASSIDTEEIEMSLDEVLEDIRDNVLGKIRRQEKEFMGSATF